MALSPTVIDLSRVPAPAAIQALDYETLLAAAIDRFLAQWEAERLLDPTLPVYDVDNLETDPAVILLQAWSYLRLLDRQRVNDAVKAVLAPFAKGTDLDNVVARANVARLTGESDDALLRRYLLAFDRPGAGTASRYLYEAWTAWPQMGDCRVNGRRTHGRRGDIDIVITGPGGRLPTTQERDLVRAAVLRDDVTPEGLDAIVLFARRAEYSVALAIEVPSGPDQELIRNDAVTRVRSAADTRTLIGGEIPPGFIKGAAFGANILAVQEPEPTIIAADPYAVPVCTGIEISVLVRS